MSEEWDTRQEIHKKVFLPRLKTGRLVEKAVCDQFLDAGFAAWQEEDWERKDLSEPNKRKGSHDIFLRLGMGVVGRIESKSSDYPWAGIDDWPFSYGAFVMTVESWESKVEKPLAVVVTSQVTGGQVVVPCGTFEHWRVRSAYDAETRTTSPTYACPIDQLISFDALLEKLRWLA